MKKTKILGIVCARAGSQGIKNKNLLKLKKKNLFEIAISQAKKCKFFDRLIVSTDSPRIIKIAKKLKVDVPFSRPLHLSTNTAKEWDVWKHALDYLKNKEDYVPDVLVAVPVTSPLRTHSDIEKCIKKYLKYPSRPVISVTNSKRSPYFNMVKKINKNKYDLVIKNKKYFRRQDVPETFDVSTIAFVISVKDVLNGSHLFEKGVNIVKFKELEALDIDTQIDYKIAKILSKQFKFL
mgnify:FL=1|jgi:CMP-N,N'-diacetyllegionaminic acid synthase